MSACFLAVLNMSISASWIVLVVLLFRLLLKKAPKWIAVLLWGIVAFRLICPFSIESVLSLIPSAETISPEIMMERDPQVYTGVPSVNAIINPIIGASFTPAPEASANPLQIWIPILAVVWIVGIFTCLAYTVISYWRVKRKIGTAVLLRDNIFQSEHVVSPFVLGTIRPKVYVPFHMKGQDMDYVIAHEYAHIRRKDHLWKPLGFLILSLHWFNPLMWVGYVLLCRDIELACDEKVIKELDAAQKADYSQALLTCSINRRIIAACPLAFGEVGVKNRVKSVLSYKKPAFALIVLAIATSIAVAVCFLTNPGLSLNKEMHTFIEQQILEHHHGQYKSGEFCCTNFKILGTKKGADRITVYMLVLYREYDQINGEPKNVSGAHICTALTLKKGDSGTPYELVEYWEPRDGSLNAKDIANKFPWYLLPQAFSAERYIAKQQEACDKAAKKHFSSIANTSGTDGPENVIASLDSLKEKYPQFFNVSTQGGLKVYIWQMSANNYRCYLINRDLNALSDSSFAFEVGASIEEMRLILSTYDVDKEDILLTPVRNPLSSYYYTIDGAYRESIKGLFWKHYPVVEAYTKYSPIIDTATFDLDGDGRMEQCTLRCGPTSGLFTFIFCASENGVPEYSNIFHSTPMDLRFEKDPQGQTVLVGTQAEHTRYMSMHVDGGNIVITSDEQDLTYWGSQGIDPPLTPTQ